MNSIHKIESKHDLFTNKYRPTKVDDFSCNSEAALLLRNWIQDFLNSSKENKRDKRLHSIDDYDYSSSDSEHGSPVEHIKTKCTLLTGPTGVGKTSLVYTVAHELGLHVVESHSAEKRDIKLLTSLKLANQKGKINPIAKLFQAAAVKDANHRVKRQKMTAPEDCHQHRSGLKQQLTLSCDTSLLLFDDIDVVFEEDGPFLKSLVDFIAESKRPIVLTASTSIDSIKKTLNSFEHIHLSRPSVEDCVNLLMRVCLREDYDKTGEKEICSEISNYFNCDVRRCLNKIQFYGNQVDKLTASLQCKSLIDPNLRWLEPHNLNTASNLLSCCYSNRLLIDLMDMSFGNTAHDASMTVKPRSKNFDTEDESFSKNLGKQIRDSIEELTMNFFSRYLMTEKETALQEEKCTRTRLRVNEVGDIISERLVTRIEPDEHEFYTDIVPLFGEVVKLEAVRKTSHVNTENLRRRSRRTPSYLDHIGLYFNDEEIKSINEIILDLSESVTTSAQH